MRAGHLSAKSIAVRLEQYGILVRVFDSSTGDGLDTMFNFLVNPDLPPDKERMRNRCRAVLIALAFLVSASRAPKLTAAFPASAQAAASPQAVASRCPAGYVLVPALKDYTAFDFCVAKYEMKNDAGNARSRADGMPWVGISRDSALTACQAIGPGYELISLDQWQTIARNIADTAANWSSGKAYEGALNTGHSDGAPQDAVAADSNDDNSCAGTGETCSSTVWNSQRRTHVLSNGSVIWDLAGNVWDLIRDDNLAPRGASGFISTFNTSDERQTRFGNDQFCSTSNAAPYCGFGWGYMDNNAGSIRRGGDADTVNGNVYGAGIFSTNLNFPTSAIQAIMGFRCSYQP